MLNPPNRRGTDPYARWCGRGGIARCPPIPIEPAIDAADTSAITATLDLQDSRSLDQSAEPAAETIHYSTSNRTFCHPRGRKVNGVATPSGVRPPSLLPFRPWGRMRRICPRRAVGRSEEAGPTGPLSLGSVRNSDQSRRREPITVEMGSRGAQMKLPNYPNSLPSKQPRRDGL